MAARSIDTGILTFGLVSIPIRVYPAVQAKGGLSMHLLHDKDGARLKQQYVCSADGEVVPRKDMIKGYEYAKDQYVTFSKEELDALKKEPNEAIEITEFVPLSAIDPVYFERTYYLGPDRGGDKAYALLSKAMGESGRAALAQYTARGKDYLVLIRTSGDHLVMHQLFHSDEVRDITEVPGAARKGVGANELKLASQLIDQITSETFRPERYEDEVRKRLQETIERKVEGEEITAAPAARDHKAPVVDLMEALKKSLSHPRAAHEEKPARARGGRKKAAVKHTRRSLPRAARRSRPAARPRRKAS